MADTKKGITTNPTSATTITTVFLVPQGGVEKEWFQQSFPTQLGAGEKETLNIHVVGKSNNGVYSCYAAQASCGATQVLAMLDYASAHYNVVRLIPKRRFAQDNFEHTRKGGSP